MAPRTIYANLADGLQPFNLWDQSLADMGALGITPCTATGTAALVLTPVATAFAPTPAYANNNQFGFGAPATSTGPVSANIAGLGPKNVYKSDGVTQATTGDITLGRFYQLIYSATLNSGVGGFYLQGAFSGSASDITSGTLPAAQMPTPTATTLGGIESLAPATSKWINSISTSGVPSATQPAASDITGLAASATTDTTNPANINYAPGGTGSRTRTLQSKLMDVCNILDFIPAAQVAAIQNYTTTYDATADIQNAITDNGGLRPIYFPYGKYIVTSGLTFITTSANTFASGIRIIGDGAGATIFDNRVAATARADNFSVNNGSAVVTVTRTAHGYSAGQQFEVQGSSPTISSLNMDGDWYITSVTTNTFTFNHTLGGTGTNNGTVTYSQINPMLDIDTNTDLKFQQWVDLQHFQIQNTTSPTLSTAIRLRRTYQTTIENVWINGMTNDGIHIAVPNPTSGDRDAPNQVTLRHLRVENCLRWGLNCDLRPGNNELSYLGIHDCFFSANGTASASLPPPSGGIHWKGQITNIQNTACVINQNVGLYIEGNSGLSNSCLVNGFTAENNLKKGIYITGLQQGDFSNIQMYNNDGNVATSGFSVDGTNFVCSNIRVRGAVVRATSGNNPYTAFTLTGVNADANTCSIEPGSVVFQTVGFPSTGQVAYTGWRTGSTTQQKLLTGSGTYTTPTGVKSIKVRLLGGGGGGAGSGTTPGAAGAGGTSTFGTSLLTCTGGAGGVQTVNTIVAGGTATGGDLNFSGGVGGAVDTGASRLGGAGGQNVFFSGAGTVNVTLSSTPLAGNAAIPNTGSGGSGASSGASTASGSGGAAGAALEKIISNPLATYAWGAGAGGVGGTLGTGGAAGGAGGSGIVIVDEFY